MAFALKSIVSVAFLTFLSTSFAQTPCPSTCRLDVVETIPLGMDASPNHMSTYDSWTTLIESAETSIDIGSYYWTLQGQELNHTTADLGINIFWKLVEAGRDRNVKIRIAKNYDLSKPNDDTDDLIKYDAAEVRSVNFKRWNSTGILHTKMMVVDGKHFYIGSSNFDWRALTQVKEIGMMGSNCSCLAEDLRKSFEVYWYMGENDTYPLAPGEWGPKYNPNNNMDNPISLVSDGVTYDSYFSNAPPEFCPENRTGDLDAIFDVIDKAEDYVHIAVMDYFPLLMFTGNLTYWPELDDKLKSTAINRRVKVKLLMAKWNNTRNNAEQFLKSLESVSEVYPNVDLQVKMYVVPADEDQVLIPYSRVNHNKYVVTEKSTLISTSNWSGDYFVTTAGMAMIITPKSVTSGSGKDVREQMADVFMRDWNSVNAKNISEIYPSISDCKSSSGKVTIGGSSVAILTLLFLGLANYIL